MNIAVSFSFIPVMASEEMIREYFFTNLAFWMPIRMPWQQIKDRGLDKTEMFGGGLLIVLQQSLNKSLSFQDGPTRGTSFVNIY